MKRIVILALSVACLSSFTAFASDSPKANPFTQTLSGVTSAELPAKAAVLVKHTRGHARVAATEDIVKAAVGLNPAAAPAIVGAISKAVPQMAAIAAGTAAAQVPKLANEIARAAAVAAPSKAAKIVVAVCRAVPNQYRSVALSVSDAVPGSSKAVLKAVATALPELNASIESSLTANDAAPVGMTLDEAAAVTASSAAPALSLPRGPTVNPPFLPLSGTPQYINQADVGFVPNGGRNYAAP